MGIEKPEVSVIVPTMASSQRGWLLRRAIASVRASSDQRLTIIVVVNGNGFEPELCAWLEGQADVHVDYVSEPSAPGAVLRGRKLVTTEFFSCLDDDDEYLPYSTDRKLDALKREPDCDLLVANAFKRSTDSERLLYPDLAKVRCDPLGSLMRHNWLTSGNCLFRSRSVGVEYFEEHHPFAEWTWLAFRLAMHGKRVTTMDEPVCRYNDTADSLSKSKAYFQSYIPLYSKMLALDPPRHVVALIHRKIGAAHHHLSHNALNQRNLMAAWQHHLRSLLYPGGHQYVGYTRHLLLRNLSASAGD